MFYLFIFAYPFWFRGEWIFVVLRSVRNPLGRTQSCKTSLQVLGTQGPYIPTIHLVVFPCWTFGI